jgi:hypothetical protein
LYGCGKCRHGNRLQAAASWTTESFWRLRYGPSTAISS